MAFAEHITEIGDDLTTYEEFLGSPSSLKVVHMLGVYSAHEAVDYQLEAYKSTDRERPYVAFSWQTEIDATHAGALLLDANQIEGLDAERGDLFVVLPHASGPLKYPWDAKDTSGVRTAGVKDIERAQLIRIEVEKATLVWNETGSSHSEEPRRFSIITAESVASGSITKLLEETASDEIKTSVLQNIERMTDIIARFNQMPFYERLFETLPTGSGEA